MHLLNKISIVYFRAEKKIKGLRKTTFNLQGVENVFTANCSTGFIPLTVDAVQPAGLKIANTQN